MLMDADELSRVIRMKKKQMMEADPELIGTDPRPDIDAQGVYDLQEKGRIEEGVGAPPKINADDANMAMEHQGIGESPEELARMGRLKSMLMGMSLSGR